MQRNMGVGTRVVSQDLTWLSPPKDLSLGEDQVHVWCASLRLSASRLLSLTRILSTDERAKAERYRIQTARDDYIIARGLLRTLLGCYLDVDPRRINFSYGLYGKPILAVDSGRKTIHFNVSHSEGLALFAVTRGREVGVDLERIRLDINYEEIAQQVFSRKEAESLSAVASPMLRREEFFSRWTSKEAYVKARGAGFYMPLDQFEVFFTGDEGLPNVVTREPWVEATPWTIVKLRPWSGYAGAVASERHDWKVLCWRWQEG